MTTERLYAKHAAEILAELDNRPTEPFTFERRQLEEWLVRRLEIVSELAADEDDAAYQSGYDIGYEDGQDKGREDMDEEMSALEDKVSEHEDTIETLSDQVSELKDIIANLTDNL